MTRTPEEQYLHNIIESYVAPLRKEIEELHKEIIILNEKTNRNTINNEYLQRKTTKKCF